MAVFIDTLQVLSLYKSLMKKSLILCLTKLIMKIKHVL